MKAFLIFGSDEISPDGTFFQTLNNIYYSRQVRNEQYLFNNINCCIIYWTVQMYGNVSLKSVRFYLNNDLFLFCLFDKESL